MLNAKKVYGRDILFYRGNNYEWDVFLSAYVAMKGPERTLLESELPDALKESGHHPDSHEAEDPDSQLFSTMQLRL